MHVAIRSWVLPRVNGNLNARVNACIINAVITRPRAPPPDDKLRCSTPLHRSSRLTSAIGTIGKATPLNVYFVYRSVPEASIRTSPSVVSTRQKDMPSLSIHAIVCLSSRWWCPGPDDDSLVETNTHTLIIDFSSLAACKPSPLNRLSCRTFLQTVYKPSTNRPTNRARRLGNPYKPYKPYTRGAYFPTPQIVTVCTVCRNSLGTVHGL